MEKNMSVQKYSQEILTNKVFEFIFGCAMHDAILQQSFKGKKDWVGKVTEARSPLREYIDKIFKNEFKNQQEHDLYFLKTVNAICKTINENKPENAIDIFSFGNAQKLINMTAKHFYSICYLDPAERFKFQFCHCPLDSIMVKEIWKKYREEKGVALRKKDLNDDFCKSWGDEGLDDGKQPELKACPDRYNRFQKAVKALIGESDIYPIEFDYLIWKQ